MRARSLSKLTALVIVLTITGSNVGFAQDAGETIDGREPFELSPQQWQERLEKAKQRSQEFVANAQKRRGLGDEENDENQENERIADERIVNDQSLQPGDIVMTSKGALIFLRREAATPLSGGTNIFERLSTSPKTPNN